LLESQATLASEGTRVLSCCIRRDQPEDTADLLSSLLNGARELDRSITIGLRETPFAPMTQEDLRAISANLIGILSSISLAAGQPCIFESVEQRLCEALNGCAASVASAISTLPAGSLLTQHARDIASHARTGELSLRDSVLQSEDADPIRLVQQCHAGRALRTVFRRYRQLSRTLEYAKLRNG
jgi:hypothetical protein